ncbi:hypothetical protein FRC08_007064 [Ceratobasidium sp. 394]|nr:hypothetical protein FRC08_007064 [Ceratobasidium sp. 394]
MPLHTDSSDEDLPKTKLHRPDLAKHTLIDGAQVVIPPVIENIMRKGFRTYFPLTFVHPDFLHSPDAARYAKVAIGLASGTKSATQLTEAGSSGTLALEERNMALEDWLGAWEHLIRLIRKYLPRPAYKAWKRHWTMIYEHRDRKSHWPRLMLYCIRIRQSATQINFNPGIWQERVYKEIIQEDRDAISARKSSHPTPSTVTASRTTHSYASTTVSAPASANLPKKPKIAREVNPRERCFCCGSRGLHFAKDCSATKLHNKQPLVVRRTGSNWTIDNNPFCYSFNTLKGCTKSPCPNVRHLCSLCRSTDHGAQTCPQGPA